MKKITWVFLISFLSPLLVFAQKDAVTKAAELTESVKADTGKKWHTGGIISVNFTQASFVNWAAGGMNSLGLTALVSLHANYIGEKISWLNDAELGYGIQKVGDDLFQKTTDQIELTSSIGYKLFDHTSLCFLTNFQTQFQPGYSDPGDTVLISKFMAPAYWVLALGLQYNPVKGLHIFLSPAAARITFVEDQELADEGAFGVDSGKKVLIQFGAYFKGNYTHEIVKNVNLTTELELFSNYLKDPQNIVVNWTTFLQLKVNKYISAAINTQMIYDNNVIIPVYKEENGVSVLVGKGPRLQFKEVIGVGLAVNLKN